MSESFKTRDTGEARAVWHVSYHIARDVYSWGLRDWSTQLHVGSARAKSPNARADALMHVRLGFVTKHLQQ